MLSYSRQVAVCCCALLPILVGCAGQADVSTVTPTPSDGTSNGVGIAGTGDNTVGPSFVPQTLTSAETDAIRSVLDSLPQLTQAAITAQAAINTGAGACPAITTAGITSSISFGGGCTVATAPEFVCSGNAIGTRTDEIGGLTPRGRLALTLQNVACAPNPPVSGTADVIFLAATPTDLNGTWNLNYSQAGAASNVAGNGDLQYDATRRFVNIVNFNGQLNARGTPLTLSLLGLALSRTTAESAIPFTGTATVTGPNIRPLTLIFDANSPTTGEIQVNAGGGTPFVVNTASL